MSKPKTEFDLSNVPGGADLIASAREAFATDTNYAVAVANYAGIIASRRAEAEDTESPVETAEPPAPHACPSWHSHAAESLCRDRHGCRCSECSEAAQERLRARRERDREVHEARPVVVTFGTPKPAPAKPAKRARPERIQSAPKPARKKERPPLEHPSPLAYRRGCRCVVCVEQREAAKAEAREAARNRPILPDEHGKAGAYGRGCRCQLCTEYKKTENKKYHARKAARLSAENS